MEPARAGLAARPGRWLGACAAERASAARRVTAARNRPLFRCIGPAMRLKSSRFPPRSSRRSRRTVLPRRLLARPSHQPSTASSHLPVLAALSPIPDPRRTDSTLSAPESAPPCQHRHLHRLVTKLVRSPGSRIADSLARSGRLRSPRRVVRSPDDPLLATGRRNRTARCSPTRAARDRLRTAVRRDFFLPSPADPADRSRQRGSGRFRSRPAASPRSPPGDDRWPRRDSRARRRPPGLRGRSRRGPAG